MTSTVTDLKHTQYVIYLVLTFSIACVLIDSAQVSVRCDGRSGASHPG